MRTSNRRKKLHGSSCKAARTVLVKELKGLSLQDFKETREVNAYLCYRCEKLLNSLNDSRMVVEDVARKVSGLKKVDRQLGPPAKRACTGQGESGIPQLATSNLGLGSMLLQHTPQPLVSGVPQVQEPSVLFWHPTQQSAISRPQDPSADPPQLLNRPHIGGGARPQQEESDMSPQCFPQPPLQQETSNTSSQHSSQLVGGDTILQQEP